MKTFEIKLTVKVENEADIKHILPAIEDGMEFTEDEGIISYRVTEVCPPLSIKWRGFEFELVPGELSRSASLLNLISPEYYESHTVCGLEPKELDYVCALVDCFDFRNRDLVSYPITEEERALIKNNFSEEEVRKYFPEIVELKLINGGKE